jgi:hypothetical protein
MFGAIRDHGIHAKGLSGHVEANHGGGVARTTSLPFPQNDVIGRDKITKLLGFKPFNSEILGRLASRRGVKLAPSRPIRGLGALANLTTGILWKVTKKVLRFQ